MSLDLKLTPGQQKSAVELFAQGFSRSEVALHLIEQEANISDAIQVHGEDKVREHLREKLRSCDPSSTRFAVSKHKRHYDEHIYAMQKACSNVYESLVLKSTRQIEQALASVQEKGEEIDHHLDSALETAPIGASEYISMMTLRMSVKKRELELQDKLLERLERIHQRTIKF